MKWLALFVTGGFIVLASYAAGAAGPYWDKPVMHRHATVAKPVTLWRSREAAVLADVYGLKPGELETATHIFKEQ